VSEGEYNWSVIMRGAIPSGIGVVLAFSNLTSNWRWIVALLCIGLAYGIVSFSSKKKQDLFTSVAIVFAVALMMHALSRAGMI
jgi:type II secretory pathway component PulF